MLSFLFKNCESCSLMIEILNCFHSELDGTPTTSQSPPPSIQTELIMLSIPAIAGQAIEPLAQLMETAYIGRLGLSYLAVLCLDSGLYA
jgi:Na+-driven multidrug efflux pump